MQGEISLIRSILERLVRNVTFRRRLPSECGGAAIVVSPDSALQFIKPSYSEGVRSVLSQASHLLRGVARI